MDLFDIDFHIFTVIKFLFNLGVRIKYIVDAINIITDQNPPTFQFYYTTTVIFLTRVLILLVLTVQLMRGVFLLCHHYYHRRHCHHSYWQNRTIEAHCVLI